MSDRLFRLDSICLLAACLLLDQTIAPGGAPWACATVLSNSRHAARRQIESKRNRRSLMPACFRSFLSIRPLHKITRRKCGASGERSRIGIILSDGRTVAVGIHDRAARLENGWILRGHDVRAEI